MSDEIDEGAGAEDDAPLRQRSPSYPVIDLGTAIERAQGIGRLSLKHAVPLTRAAKEWGYSARSSNIPKVVAALKRFDLAEVQGGGGPGRQIKLTDFARELLFYETNRDTGEWRSLIREAAERPPIYRDLMQEFGLPLPDASVIEHFLVFKRGFNEQAAHDCVLKLRRTIDFAELVEAGAGDDEPVTEPVREPDPEPAKRAAVRPDPGPRETPRDGGAWRAAESGAAERYLPPRAPEPSIYDHFSDREVVQVPYSHGEWASVRAKWPMTEGEWDMFMNVLGAMKPALVQDVTEHPEVEVGPDGRDVER